MVELQAVKRTNIGKGLNSLRREGILPAVLYGENIASTPLAVPIREFEKVLKSAGETSLVALSIEGSIYNVLIHDVAKDPLTLAPIHADFYAVRMDKPIQAKIPLSFTGESPAVKNEGGILVKIIRELEVRALPKDLPHEISIDVSTLGRIGDKIYVRDVSLPGGVTVHTPLAEVVALVEPPRSDAELEALAKVEATSPVAEVKTEREAKTETKEAATEAEAEETA